MTLAVATGARPWMKPAAVAAVSFAVLFGRAASRVPEGWAGEWDVETTMLVTSSVFHRERAGALAPMGYPFDVDRTKAPIWKADGVYEPYLRQVGVVPAALALLAPSGEDEMERFLLGCRQAFAALTSLAAAALIALLAARAGLLPAAGALAAVAASRAFADFSRSLYWTPFLALAAVGWCWLGIGRMRRGWMLWGGFAALVALKCLNGYEHLTALLLAPLAAIAFERPDLRALKPSVAALASGIAGFLAAFGAHLAYLWVTVGRAEALANTFGKAWQRSVGEPVSPGSQLFGAYSVFAHDHVLSGVVAVWLVAVAAALLRRRLERLRPLALASAVALAGASSWMVLARGHTALAPQFNMLPFYFGGTMLLGACSAEALRAALGRGSPAR